MKKGEVFVGDLTHANLTGLENIEEPNAVANTLHLREAVCFFDIMLLMVEEVLWSTCVLYLYILQEVIYSL